jgi:hypothetical protein
VNLENAKIVYVVVCVFLGFIILAPTLFAFAPIPQGEKFSELWFLGPNRMIVTGTLDVLIGKSYLVYLGIGNHMGGLEYYTVYVKLRNQSEAFQEAAIKSPSSLEPIFEYRLFLGNNETWEKDFVFSFEDVSFDENLARITMLSIDGDDVSADAIITKDETDSRFYCQILFELWIYNSTISALQYHDRFVGFWINLNR